MVLAFDLGLTASSNWQLLGLIPQGPDGNISLLCSKSVDLGDVKQCIFDCQVGQMPWGTMGGSLTKSSLSLHPSLEAHY